MKPKPVFLLIVAGVLIGAGLGLVGLSYNQRVTFLIDGQLYNRRVNALTVGDALSAARVTLAPGDSLSPPPTTWLWGQPVLRIDRAVAQRVVVGSQRQVVLTRERIAANVLELGGLRLFPGDQLLIDGAPVQASAILPLGSPSELTLKTAVRVTLIDQGQTAVFYSGAATLGQAIQQAGISLDPLDSLSLDSQTLLSGPLVVSVTHPRPIELTADGKTRALRTQAASVGQALSQAGVHLVGLDYSQPGEADPIPADGRIRVVRVRETVTLTRKTIPFETITQADPKTELDQRSVVQVGVEGLLVTRVRVRAEDGQEVSRKAEAEWQARAPVKRILGYGTQVVLHTTSVDGVTIQYYRAVTVYATSYSPCDAGACSYLTASGAKVEKGVIGVGPVWYNLLRGQQVYVPGYGSGVIADYGNVGTYRIDLAYSDSDYVPWHKNVTLYFLAPPPANIPWTLP